ncbi:MAG: DUF433 domain-containing protein [Fimbriimonadaceae bacterium]|nr:DUF433 domain-containing protein [Fimbriimonadaceae bacterium]
MASELRFAIGAYSIADAARFLRQSVASVRRWSNGYTYRQRELVRHRHPVLVTDRRAPGVLNFAEIVELRFVAAFRRAGVSLEHLRRAARTLEPTYGPYPFANARLIAHGGTLLEMKEWGAVSPVTRQHVLAGLEAYVAELGFVDDLAARWEPKEGLGKVLLDPTRQFGQPILAASGTPTRVVFREFNLDPEAESIAEWYGLEPDDVKAAVSFERAFAAAG